MQFPVSCLDHLKTEVQQSSMKTSQLLQQGDDGSFWPFFMAILAPKVRQSFNFCKHCARHSSSSSSPGGFSQLNVMAALITPRYTPWHRVMRVKYFCHCYSAD